MQEGDVHRQQHQGLAGDHQGQQAQGDDRQMDGQGVTQGAAQVGLHSTGQFRQGPLASVLLHPVEEADAHHKQEQNPGFAAFTDQGIDQGAGQQEQVGGLQEGGGDGGNAH